MIKNKYFPRHPQSLKAIFFGERSKQRRKKQFSSALLLTVSKRLDVLHLAGVLSAVKAANPPHYCCVNLRMNLFCFLQSEVLASPALWSLTIITLNNHVWESIPIS